MNDKTIRNIEIENAYAIASLDNDSLISKEAKELLNLYIECEITSEELFTKGLQLVSKEAK